MLKILFLIPTLGHGGAERVLTNLVNNMDKTKFDVTVKTLFDVGIYQSKLESDVSYIGGIKKYLRGNTLIFKLFSRKSLYNFYVKEHYDVIVSYLEGSAARIVSGCSDKNTKLVSWIHVEQESRKNATVAFRNYQEAINCYNKFDKIICVSDTVKKDFLNLFDLSVPVEVLYNTVETAAIYSRMKEEIDDIVFSKDEINICSVAKLMKTKGYDRLVRVIKRLCNDGFKVHVYILGIGEEKENLEQLVQEYDLERQWTFVGFRENPYKYVAASDLYVCSSRREGFSTAVTEALIVGTPVVSTNCSGAIELLGNDDKFGIVTENNEEGLYLGMKKMLTGDMLKEYKKKAKERGKYFSTIKTVKAVEKMLLEISKE
jgi:glycosyltransferase involved in cell wall biosynthesis